MASELHAMKSVSAVIQGLTRREMILRLAAGAAAGAAEVRAAVAHPVYKHLTNAAIQLQADVEAAKESWTPKYLDAQQNETLILLAERIVPGASKAQVNRFIDLLLSVDSSENQHDFSSSLSALDQEAVHRFGQVFRSLTEEQQDAVLLKMSTESAPPSDVEKPRSGRHTRQGEGSGKILRSRRDHFENLKSWVTGAYYSSEVGMRELGWTGEFVFDTLPSCAHPEGHV